MTRVKNVYPHAQLENILLIAALILREYVKLLFAHPLIVVLINTRWGVVKCHQASVQIAMDALPANTVKIAENCLPALARRVL